MSTGEITRRKLGAFFFGGGFIGLFIGVVSYLRSVVPPEIKSFGRSNNLTNLVLVSLVLIILGYIFQKKKFTKPIFVKHLKGYFSQIISTLSIALIVIILFTDLNWKMSFILGILFISFILYLLSEEVKQ